jgi:dolichol-phosphate mannosyltransferase
MQIYENNIFFSIIMPAHNEEENIEKTCVSIVNEFEKYEIFDYEILVINDNSSDGTEKKLQLLSNKYDQIRYLNNKPPNGFGLAIKKGLDNFLGETVCIVMADLSDAPEDILKYYYKMKEGYECVFGSRFIKGSKVIDYPSHKLLINRFANWFIKFLFRIDHNDITNAFKCYRREVIDGIRPILSYHFNLTVELPLKAIVRGYSYTTIPISWRNREKGISKLKIKEMGSRYLFIVLYIFLEKLLSRGDYKRTQIMPQEFLSKELS